MNILAAIKREEGKLEKQLKKVQHQLDGVRSAAKALGHTAAVEVRAQRSAFAEAQRAGYGFTLPRVVAPSAPKFKNTQRVVIAA